MTFERWGTKKKGCGQNAQAMKGPLFVVRMVAACLLLCIVLVGCKQGEETVSSVAGVPAPHISEPHSSSVPQEPETKPEAERFIDFDELLARNEDVIAWVELPGTIIDYPVMRGLDNAYYLRHDIDGNYSVTGEVFLDMYSAEDFDDPVTVLYGHYWEDDSYFTQLHRFKDPNFFAENRGLTIYQPDGPRHYEIVAAFTTGDQHLLYGHNFENTEEMREFIDFISIAETQQDANADLSGVTEEDRLLVLSTCTQLVGGSNRFLVVAREV